MDAETLKLKIDSAQARDDLAKLSKALDQASSAAAKQDKALSKMASSADASMKKAGASMERYARVASEISKVKFTGDPSAQIRQFSQALDQLGRVRTLSDGKIENLKSFFRLMPMLKAPTGTAQLSQFIGAIAQIKAPSTAQVTNLREMVKVLDGFKGGPRGTQSLGQFVNTISALKAPSSTTVARLKELFAALASAKEIPNAARIARDLDMVAAAAGRATNALGRLPTSMRNLGGGVGAAQRNFASLGQEAVRTNKVLGDTEARSRSGLRGMISFGSGVDGLTSRFRVGYQAGTLFSAMFSAFTFGQFIKGVYDTSIQFQKLNKAMFFITGSFDGAKKATAEYIQMSNQLGVRIDTNSAAYSRFAINASASGMSLEEANKVYRGTVIALQAVGASAQQTEYAFYGMSQMLSKGKVMSEEFNRQVGEQIPGNVQAGVKALTVLTGQQKTANDLFDLMRKGALQSAPFMKEWAKQLEAMYTPLLPLALRRPDVQIGLLMNAFLLFKKRVADGGFIAAFTSEIGKLTSTLLDKNGNLSQGAGNLADKLSRGLAGAVRDVGSALRFLASHLDEVVMVAKGLAMMTIAHQLGEWGKSAATAAEGFVKLAGGMLTVRRAQTVATVSAAPATAASVAEAMSLAAVTGEAGTRTRGGAATVMGGAGMLAQFGPVGANGPQQAANYQRLRDLGYGHEDAAFYARRDRMGEQNDFWKRGDLGSAAGVFGQQNGFGRRQYGGPQSFNAVPEAGAGLGLGERLAGAGSAALAASSKAATAAFGAFRVGLNALPGVAMAAAVAVAAFSDKMVTIGKNGAQVSVGDIAGGGAKNVGKSIGAWANEAAAGLRALVGATNNKQGGKGVGDGLLDLAAGLITVGKVVFAVASTIGKTIGLVVSVIGDAILGLTAALASLAQGKFHDAKVWVTKMANPASNFAEYGRQIGDDWRGATDFAGTRAAIAAGAQGSANDRANAHNTDANNQAWEQQAEAARQQMMAADMQARAAQDMHDATAGFKAAMRPINFENDILPRIQALIAGKPLAMSGVGTVAPGAGGHNWGALSSAWSPGGDSASVSTPRTVAAEIASRPPQDVALAINAASQATGVSSKLLAAIAKRESSFNPYAANPSSSARGLFQFGYDTAKQYGLTSAPNRAAYMADPGNAYNANMSANAAARLAIDNKAYLQARGMNPSDGDLYAAHFMGKSGAYSLAQSAARDPQASFAQLFPRAAAANSFTRGMTVGQVYANLRATAGDGGAGIPTGGAAAAIQAAGMGTDPNAVGGTPTDATADSLTKTREIAYKSMQGVLGVADPGAAAAANFQEQLVKMTEGVQEEENLFSKMKDKSGFESFFKEMLPDLLRAVAKLKRDAADAADPFAKLNRISEQATGVTAKRVKGMSDEADYQTKLNELYEQGYDISKLNTEQAKKQFIADQQRVRLQQSQLDLTKALNEADISRISRTGNAYDATLAGLVGGKSMEGESYAQTLARLKQEGSLGNLQAAASAQQGERQAGAVQDIGTQMTEELATAHLSPSAAAYRNDFKSYLESLTGVSGKTLSYLEAQNPALTALAKQAADLKYSIENAPGFVRWADGLEPVAKRLEDIKAQFAQNLSSSITDALSGDKVDWRAMVHSTAKQFLQVQVDQVLGAGIHGLFGNGATAGAPGLPGSTGPVSAIASALGVPGATGAAATAAGSVTMTAGMVYLSAQGIMGGGGLGGGFGGLGSTVPMAANGDLSLSNPLAMASDFSSALPMIGAAASAASGGGLNGYPDLSAGLDPTNPAIPLTNNSGMFSAAGLSTALPAMAMGKSSGGGLLGALGGGLLPMALAWLTRPSTPKVTPTDPLNGLIGTPSSNNVSATQVAAHGNIIGDLISMAAQVGGSKGFGATGGNLTKFLGAGGSMGDAFSSGLSGMMSAFGFSEGGYSTAPVHHHMVSPSAFVHAPHFSEGTANTSGIPAILHDNEAVVPLSRGRKIPVDMGDQQPSQIIVHSPMNIYANDADSFRSSRAAIERKQNRTLRRAASRNLTAAAA